MAGPVPSKRETILIVEPDSASREALRELLQAAGYEVASVASSAKGFEAVRYLSPDMLILAADPADLRCCEELSEIKGSSATSNTRVILLTPGGAAERARGLDLGADDVLSSPWDAAELLARVRGQLRAKRSLDGLKEKTRLAEESRQLARTAFRALAATEKMARDAFSASRALKIGVPALFAVAVILAGIFLLYSRRAEKEARHAHSVIAQLERGMHKQEDLLAEARRAREEQQQTNAAQQKQALEKQSEELRARLAGAESSDVSALKKQLQETSVRLRRMENESKRAEEIIRSFSPSVCLLHVSVAFSNHASARRLHYAGINPDGQPLKDSDGNPVFTLDGPGPEVRADFFGTGFLVGSGRILTNHHVAQPWWKNDDLNSVLQQGLDPVIAEMTAYFPDAPVGFPVGIEKISDEADLAAVAGDLPGLKRAALGLDPRKDAAVSGQSLISMGYATGLGAILARAGEATVQDIVKATGGAPKRVMGELARRRLIRPLVTQGHLGDVLADKIVYDAQTTSGGSGGPLFNPEGKVIGVTFAVVKDFGGSNFGVPIRFAQPLLKR